MATTVMKTTAPALTLIPQEEMMRLSMMSNMAARDILK
jgi:hypothetical protein